MKPERAYCEMPEGERLSRQGRAVLEVLRQGDDHPTAEQVLSRVRRQMPHVSLGTVYRNLDKLVRAGQAMRVPDRDGRMRYDGRTGSHCHARCTKCGRVVDVDLGLRPEMSEQVRKRTGFRLTGASLVFDGLCPDCAADNKASNQEEQEEQP